MRIFIVVDSYLPSTKSSAKLIHDLALEFCMLGHEATVITISETIESDYEVVNKDGINVLRVKSGRIDGASKITRAINELLLSRNIWKKGREFFQNSQCDLVVWYSPSIFFGSLIRKIKKRYSASSYLILRDIFPQWAVDTGILKKGIIFKFFQMKEFEQYRAADIIGVQSPANLDYFYQKGLEKKLTLEVLYNWTKTVELDISFSNYRDRFGLQDKLVFFYGGNIGVAQDLDNVVRLAESLRQEHLAYFLIVGKGSESKRLKEVVAKKKLVNIAIHEAVDQKEYLAMLSEFDVGLISLDRNFKTSNFPGKMLGYMYFSIPILASINSGNDLKSIVEEFNAGLVSINGDDTHFKENALRMIHNSEERTRFGSNSRNLLEKKFSVSHAAKQILTHFKS